MSTGPPRKASNMETPGKLARISALATRGEDGLAATALLAMGILPVLELALRSIFNTGIPGSSGYVQHLTLWVGFLGAMIASREHSHLTLSSGVAILPRYLQRTGTVFAATVSTAVASGLFWASLQFVCAEVESPNHIAGFLPIWAVESILPLAFAAIALRSVAQPEGWRARGLAFLGVPAAAVIGFLLASYAPVLLWPGIASLVVTAILGAPVFVVLGGTALLLFVADGVRVASIPVETYRIIVSPSIPTIPLFTLAGYILAEGRASQRLVRLFRALFGWMPGGLPIAATLVCAFFTTFTGASGVTILALGGLLLPVLLQSGYLERFSVGLLTATGSIGLLFPPSLPVILYGVVAHIPIPDLFKAGILPGILMIAVVCIFGVLEGVRSKSPRPRFETREAATALWESKWEILLPVIALVGIFGGFRWSASASLTRSSAQS